MKTLALVALLVSAVVSPARADERNCAEQTAAGKCSLYAVSLIELIANPAQYAGQRVRVIGYLHLEFEGNGVYLSQNDVKHAIYKNGLWVEVSGKTAAGQKKANNGYALIEGRFNPNNPGHMGLWSGALEAVSRLEAWPPK